MYTICLKAMTKGQLIECHKVNLLSDNQKITMMITPLEMARPVKLKEIKLNQITPSNIVR